MWRSFARIPETIRNNYQTPAQQGYHNKNVLPESKIQSKSWQPLSVGLQQAQGTGTKPCPLAEMLLQDLIVPLVGLQWGWHCLHCPLKNRIISILQLFLLAPCLSRLIHPSWSKYRAPDHGLFQFLPGLFVLSVLIYYVAGHMAFLCRMLLPPTTRAALALL